jgi:hypothetical protein
MEMDEGFNVGGIDRQASLSYLESYQFSVEASEEEALKAEI